MVSTQPPLAPPMETTTSKSKRKRPLVTAPAIAAPATPSHVAPSKAKQARRSRVDTTSRTDRRRGRDMDDDDDLDDPEDGELDDDKSSNSNSNSNSNNNSSNEAHVDGQDVIATTPAGTTTAGDSEEKPKPRRGRRRILHDEDQRKQRRKNQCKLNQRRYRARQRGMISALSLETDTLSEFIMELETYERFLRRYQSLDASFIEQTPAAAAIGARAVLVVNHFARVFRHGFALHSVECSDLQERFVRFICSSNLVSQGTRRNGVDALLLQLKRYTSYHAVFALACDDVQRVWCTTEAGGVVQLVGRMHLRLSRDTIMLVFPHIVANEHLSHRVVGQTIEPEIRIVFQFDESGKVSKIEWCVDFTRAFMHLLESATDVATLLRHALISPECELGIDPHDDAATTAASTRDSSNKHLSLKYILL